MDCEFKQSKSSFASKNMTQWTPFHLACLCGHYESVEVLLKYGMKSFDSSNGGWEPLQEAVSGREDASESRLKIVKALLNYCSKNDIGLDLDHCVHTGETALHIAVANGLYEVVKVLLEAGADPRKIDFDGRTPKDYAKGKLRMEQLFSVDFTSVVTRDTIPPRVFGL